MTSNRPPQQTTAELDIYIKDLIRRCQFKTEEVESQKVDLLYHATVHFEVRKFVHNAKPHEFTYDKMIEVAKAHERTCHEYQLHKQAHAGPASSYHNPIIQTNALAKSFQKKKPCGKCGRIHNHRDCPADGQTCHSCVKKNHWTQMCRIRRSSTGRTPFPHCQQNRQRQPSGNRKHKQQGGGGGGKGSGKFFKKGTPNKKRQEGLPTNKNIALLEVVMGGNSVSNHDGLSGPSHPPEDTYSLSGPPHPPKEKYSLQTNSGEACSNPFTCYALGNGNEELYDDSNKKYKVYTDTDSDGEIITDITCKYKGKIFAM